MSNQHYDVIVVGGGASGMMAAGRAAELGKRVLLVEKNKELGKKLSITGGGRCNILNAEPDTRKLLSYYGSAAKFLHSPFAQHTMNDSYEFFESRGLPLKIESNKRAFPVCESAPEVVNFMKRYCTEGHVEIRVKTMVLRLLVKDGAIYGVETDKGKAMAPGVILATGGASHPETGATSEGVEWLSKFGHKVQPATPSLVPLKVSDEWVKRVSGVSMQGVKVTFEGSGKSAKRFCRTGTVLCTHFGLSGPTILNASAEVKEMLKHGQVKVYFDLFPHTDEGALRTKVRDIFDLHKNKAVKNILKEIIMPRMIEGLAAQIPLEILEKRVHSVTKEERNALADSLKQLRCTVIDTMGLDWAVLADGGVQMEEVDTRTMESKVVKGLYLTGDTLNTNRPTGGYSLQLCWTTGWVAGNHA